MAKNTQPIRVHPAMFQALTPLTSNRDFIIHQFKRIANPKRPSEEEIKKAREIVTLSNTPINFSSKITQPKTYLDTAMVVLKKVRLPKFKDYIYTSNAPISDIITNKSYLL